MMAAENDHFTHPPQARQDAPLPGPRSRVAKILNAAQCGKEPVSTGSGLGGREATPPVLSRLGPCRTIILSGPTSDCCSPFTVENALRLG